MTSRICKVLVHDEEYVRQTLLSLFVRRSIALNPGSTMLLLNRSYAGWSLQLLKPPCTPMKARSRPASFLQAIAVGNKAGIARAQLQALSMAGKGPWSKQGQIVGMSNENAFPPNEFRCAATL